MKTETDLDVIVRELVEWKDGWEMLDNYHIKNKEKDRWAETVESLKQSLDLVRELEEGVCAEHDCLYCVNLCLQILGDGYEMFKNPKLNWSQVRKLILADPEPRLRALHRTLREAGEI